MPLTIKPILTILLAILGHQNEFNLKNIQFGQLDFYTSRSEILEKFGPAKITYPKYECGFHSDDEQDDGPFYQLVYEKFNYIGSKKRRFQIEEITFDQEGKIFMKYNKEKIDGTMTPPEIDKILGTNMTQYFKINPKKNSQLINSAGSDHGAIFTFKNGLLTKFKYHSPC